MPRGAGLSVQVMDHVETEITEPVGYAPTNTRIVKGIPETVFSRSGARTFARGGYGL